MALIPSDVDLCCTMDMDRFLGPGWSPKLEAARTEGTTALFCRVEYRSRADDPTLLRGWPAKDFYHRWGYRFKRPIHETLFYTGEEVTRDCADIVVYEVQDHDKSIRQQYLPLMELAHQEDPDDAQICSGSAATTCGLTGMRRVSTDARNWTLSDIENWTPGLSDVAPRLGRGGLSR